MLRSYDAVNVVAVVEFPDDKVELSWLSKLEDSVWEGVIFVLYLVLGGPRTLRSMKSEIKPGFVILLSSTSFSPVSILTTVDMEGRSFGVSWVHSKPIFRNLQASSASNSPFNDESTSTTSSLCS